MSKFGKELIESMKQATKHCSGRRVRGMRVTKVEIPDVKAIRRSLRMSRHRLARIVTAERVIHGVLKLVFADGYECVVDLRPIIAHGTIFTWLQEPNNFRRVQLEKFGHHVFWIDDKGQEIDFGADSLRRDAEKQAELHGLAAS